MPSEIPIPGALAVALGLDRDNLPPRPEAAPFFRLDVISRLAASHPGLLLDRYLPFDRQQGWCFDSELKGPWLRAFVAQANTAYSTRDAAWRTWSRRHRDLYPPSCRRALKPAWRWIIGLGNQTVLETGLTLHHTYGIPFIPGPALKGLTQALVVREAEPDDLRASLGGPGTEDRKGICMRLFGDPCMKGARERQAGEVVFLGGVPVAEGSSPRLVVDVMTPHFPAYYQGRTEEPLEVEDPTPVPFLAISGGTYDVTVAPRDPRRGELIELALRLCVAALDELGIGGKTAKGYGYLVE